MDLKFIMKFTEFKIFVLVLNTNGLISIFSEILLNKI